MCMVAIFQNAHVLRYQCFGVTRISRCGARVSGYPFVGVPMCMRGPRARVRCLYVDGRPSFRLLMCRGTRVSGCLCVGVPVCQGCYVSGCLSIRLPMCGGACVSGCLCVRVPVCQGACMSGCLCVRVPVCQGACVPGCLCVRVPVCQGACVSGCLRIRLPMCGGACVSDCYFMLSVCQGVPMSRGVNVRGVSICPSVRVAHCLFTVSYVLYTILHCAYISITF
jgi:hypothetical protein